METNKIKDLFKIVFWCMVATSTVHITLHAASETTNSHDEYIQGFLRSCKSDCVTYQDGTLTLYADPSVFKMILKGLGAAASGTFGMFGIALGSSSQPREVRIFLGGIVMCALGIWLGTNVLNDITIKATNQPYLIFDKEGLSLFSKPLFSWSVADDVQLRSLTNTNINEYGFITTRTRNAEVVDKYLNILLSLSDKDNYLPVSFENFIALTRHYIETYGRKQ
jgi:hypothetical protein